MKVLRIALLGAALLSGAALAQPTPPAGAKPQSKLGAAAPVTQPKVMMLRLYVANIARGEKFYHEVFGATVVQKMGDNVRIMMFPGMALPGIILIQSKDEVTMNGSFVIQVPDLAATLAKAQANGGKLLNTKFEQQAGPVEMRSSHFYDPDGNLIEVMQSGGVMPKMPK